MQRRIAMHDLAKSTRVFEKKTSRRLRLTTEQQLEAIQAREASATRGPWDQCRAVAINGEPCPGGLVWSEPMDWPVAHCDTSSAVDGVKLTTEAVLRNAEFIAHARDDIPWLLEELALTKAALANARATEPVKE